MQRLNTLLRAALLALGSCGVAGPPPAPSPIGAEWNCLPTPAGFDGAGFVYSTKPDGFRSPPQDFVAEARVATVPFAGARAIRHSVLSGSQVARLLQAPATLDAPAGSFNVTETFGDATLSSASAEGVANVASQFKVRSDLGADSTYYLIEGSIAAMTVTYDFDRSIGPALAAMVGRLPYASYSEADGARFTQNFTYPANVCVRTVLLSGPGGRTP